MELSIAGVALAPVIVALVQGAKALGLPSKYAPLLNAALSVAVFAAVVYLSQNPQYETVASYVVNALVIFLSGAGLYTTVQTVRGA